MFDGILDWTLAMNLWTGALLLAAIALDRLLARRVRAGWRIALFATLLVRLALPVDWRSPLGAIGFDAPTAAADVGVPAQGADVGVAATVASATAPEPTPASVVVPAKRPGDPWFIAWCAVATTLLGVVVLRHRALARELRRALPARALVRARARGARVVEHEHLGPLTFGIVHPQIVLPRAVVERLGASELGHVLDHERAHAERRDGALAMAMACTCAVLWPIVPLWIAASCVRALMERAADERALTGASDADRVAFGRTLVRLADAPTPGALALGSYRDLHGRIAALRGARPLPGLAQTVAIAAAVAVPLACAGHAESGALDPARCGELRGEATAAHDRFERGEADQAAIAQAAYDTFARACEDDADHGEILYYRAELYWARAHALLQAGGDTRGAFALAHAAFLEALDAGEPRFVVDAATAQMLAKRAELDVRDPQPPDATPRDRPHVHRGPSIHETPATVYGDGERALLASYDIFEDHVTALDNEDLQRVLLSRASLAMTHHRFAEARAPLERLLAVDLGTQWQVRGAEALLDLQTIAWTDPSATDEARARAADELLALCERLPTLALWQHASATRLQQAVPTLRAGVTRTSG